MAKPVQFQFFIAALLPQDMAQSLYDGLAPLRAKHPDWRWSTPDQYHVTLQFPGPEGQAAMIRGEDVPAFVESLEGLRIPPATLDLAAFDVLMDVSGKKPHILGARFDAAARDAFTLLRSRIDIRLTNQGYALSGLPFNPHMTLARVPAVHHDLMRKMKRNGANLPALKWDVREFHAVQCLPNHLGMKYNPIAAYQLHSGERDWLNQPISGKKSAIAISELTAP